MSQLFDYFVCPLPMIERWAEALEQQDEELQQKIESEMPQVVPLKNLSMEFFNFLARCVESEEVDTVKAAGDVDLVRAVSEEEGPWVMALRKPAIEAIARMPVDTPVLKRWVKVTAEFMGWKEERCREILTADAAKSLKDICLLAVKEQLGVYVCFYG